MDCYKIERDISRNSTLYMHGGLDESCSHIGVLLFKLEAADTVGFTKKACTDVACTWNQDSLKKSKAR